MTVQLATHNSQFTIPTRRPKKPSKMPVIVPDPWRQLAAAVVVEAISDALWPRIELSSRDHYSAIRFLCSEDAAAIIRGLDIPEKKITALVSLLEEATL